MTSQISNAIVPILDGFVFLEVDGRMVAAKPRPDLGPDLLGVERPNGHLRVYRRIDEARGRDVTPEIAGELVVRLREAQDRAKRSKREQHGAIKRANNAEPADWQERHSPTVADMVQLAVIGGKRIEQQQARRRMVDARTWGRLDGDLQDAAVEIERGHRVLIRGLGMKCAKFERIDPSYSNLGIESGADSASDYNGWVEEVDSTLLVDPRDQLPMRFGRGKGANRWTLERLSPEAATALICHGMSVAEIARDRGRHLNWVTENLRQALLVWCYRTNRRRRPPAVSEEQDGTLTLKQLLTRQRNRRVDKMASAITERQRVIKQHP